MSTTRVEVRTGSYHDSVRLLQVSRAIADLPDVEAAVVAMGTPLNLDLITGMGFDTPDAGPDDLVIAVRAPQDALDGALAAVDDELARRGSGEGDLAAGSPPRTTASALRRGRADLVLVSTPGENATAEAWDALRGGASVMIFSDNVPVADEVALKQAAADRDLLVMGPDCGTAIVGGVGLGFANVVRPGPVGIVAASGTGAQHVSSLLDDAGVGVSHVLGVGGRDLSAEVGASSTLRAMAALDADPATELIVVLSKPPDADVARQVRAAADGLATPSVLGFVGDGGNGDGPSDLADVAARAVAALGRDAVEPTTWGEDGAPSPERGGLLRGLFSGGTLATEAWLAATDALGEVASNVGGDAPTDGAAEHVILDLGADEYTRGRPHPMIDQRLRLDRLAAAVDDQRVGVVLLDVVLGHGAHDDPAGELADAISSARQAGVAVVVSLCGTRDDPQDRDRQAQVLQDAGASVYASNVAAAQAATGMVSP